jgi:hypothetical protein
METTPSVAAPMIQLGILLGIVLVGNAVAVRRLPTESVPGCLMGRVRLANRMRPWLAVAALAITVTGLLLHLG